MRWCFIGCSLQQLGNSTSRYANQKLQEEGRGSSALWKNQSDRPIRITEHAETTTGQKSIKG
jgi:hypothetical protein